MKIKNLYRIQSDFAFTAILLLGGLYFVIFAELIFFLMPALDYIIGVSEGLCIASGSTYIESNRELLWVSLFILLMMSALIIHSSIRQFIKIIKTRRFIKSLEVVSISNGIKVFNRDSPFIFTSGFIRPEIYMSTWYQSNLNNRELGAVVLHEKAHIKYLHNIRKIITSWILGFFSIQSKESSFEKNFLAINEMCSDEYSYEKTEEKKSLLQAMNKVLSALPRIDSSLQRRYLVSTFEINTSRIQTLVSTSKRMNIKYLFQLFSFVLIMSLLLSVARLSRIEASAISNISSQEAVSCKDTNQKLEVFWTTPKQSFFTPLN